MKGEFHQEEVWYGYCSFIREKQEVRRETWEYVWCLTYGLVTIDERRKSMTER